MLDELFTLFLKEKQYMHNNRPKTIRYFECSLKAFKRANITELSKESIINFVAHMRQSGLSARSCNDYSKGMNSFFKRLFENEFVKELNEIPMMKLESIHTIKAPHSIGAEKYFHYRYGQLRIELDTGEREWLNLSDRDVRFIKSFTVLEARRP
jgi:hypothetical protein